MKFQATQISLLISALFVAAGAEAQSTTDVGTINVEAAPGGTATGLIQPEDSPKARSSISRDFIDKQGSTQNPFQLINLLPGVNSYGYDATGLFGGGLRVRGFNSDQLGFTINGAPVNDSGSFSVFPQEYTDSENVCDIFVTQGSTDTEAPHVGATGGNVGIVSCAPRDAFGGRLSQTFGNQHLQKSFARVDSGRFLNDMAKFYVSASHAEADKFKGEGGAKRDHVDIGARLDLGRGSYIDASYLYNRAINNNYRSVSKNDVALYGKYFDFGTIAPVHAPAVAGSAQSDATYAPNVTNFVYNSRPGASSPDRYYGFNLNPFKNYLATMTGHLQILPTLSVDISPYYWYGYGTGGNELQTLAEGTGGSRLHGGVRDINGDGDRLDTVGTYEGSVTKTYRPGITGKINWQLGPNRLTAGYWFEHARHQQTAPYVRIDNTGNAEDIWLATQSQWILQGDGQPAMFRDWYTISEGKSAFATDTLSLFDDRLALTGGITMRSEDRDFTNSANMASGGGADYRIHRYYSKALPNFGATFHFTPEQQVFVNAAKNFKVPGNFSYSGLARGGTFVNGVLTGFTVRDPVVNPEYSYNYDLGYRFANDRLTLSGSLFYIDFKNRIASAYNPDLGLSVDYNVGKSISKGAEFEAGVKVTEQISVYGSVSYIKSKIEDNYRFSSTVLLPVAGKEYPDTPNWLSGLSVNYKVGGFYAFAQGKYTGKRYSTLVNDDRLPSYTTMDLGAGYTLQNTAFFKNPTIRFNVYNVFGRDFLSLSSGSGSTFTLNAAPITVSPGVTKPAEVPTFYVGAPRLMTVTLTSDF